MELSKKNVHFRLGKRARRSATSLLIRVDAASPEGLQHQVYAGIRRAILEGTAAPGTRVPSSRALAIDLGVSRTTTVLALDQLRAEGYLTAERGSGTFVAHELPDDLPQPRRSRRVVTPKHPPLSRRGAALSANPLTARRFPGPPRPFRIGVPALDLFPTSLWSRLASRRYGSVTAPQLDYGEPGGFLPLREAIAHHVQAARGTHCKADQVVIVAGAQRGFGLVCDLLLDPGSRAWMEEPGYPGARSALLAAGARIVPVRVDANGIDVADGARRARDARLVYVTPSHQFPLGVPMSLPRRLALLRWAHAAGAWIIEDDHDSEFRYGARPIPCLHGLDTDGRVIYVGSFSKTIFPALRLGFLIVPTDLIESFLAARRIGPPAIDQIVLTDFIADGHFERHLRRMRNAYQERLQALTEAVDRLCGSALTLRPTQTGLHAVADLGTIDAGAVFRGAWDRGVEVMPLSAYYSAAKPANGLLLGFGAARPDALPQGVEALAAAIEAARAMRLFA